MSHSRKVILSSIAAGGFACLIAVAIYLYANYPKVPPVTDGDPTAPLRFIGTNDFNRMFIWDRQRYARAAMQRLKELEFKDILALDPLLRLAHKNVIALPNRDQIEGLYLQTFLDKFYALNKTQRNVFLTAIALNQDKQHPLLPSAEKFKTDFAHFLAVQPPRSQAQMGQFLLDVRRQRDILGLKAPY